MKRLIGTACAVTATLSLYAAAAHASVVITGTRVVYPAQQSEVTVRLSNQADHPALVEAWIDTGDTKSTPDNTNAPFLITPPLFRMESHKDQNLRIIYTQGTQPLPTDRESVFYLNVLEVPPKPTGAQTAGRNYLQFAMQSRLKLFYRPAGLPGDVMKAPDQLRFTAQGTTLDVRNPTPYYVTIGSVAFGTDGKPLEGVSGMVAPLGDLQLTLKGLKQAPSAGTAITYATINDFGAVDTHKGVVAP
ncbi:fimbria/pilus periplasmic chaperone [Rhodanobacter sp. DHG33]|uniref:fimbrial biogenesis chaperone n=1 Tax=Rhodanobacter sp. DHG33 TaxID=2775921 RepID=UPI00177FB2B8|nr:fimbria/pilus periplasmic chaperone [Rhodanobacter sp. DHG33]MBD8897750.1 fimbria/pilus periplasmic chaperone [Rhodanobacter sp. DHG33]